MEKLQVLVATMGQKNFSKIEEMNISSDVIFANQSDETKYEEMKISGYRAKMITTTTRGVGCNRNIALSYADGDILLMADDDMQYITNYRELVLEAFKEVSDADALIFNINTIGMDHGRRQNRKVKRVYKWNALNYGAARIAVKRTRLLAENIKFSHCFGGGTLYSAGEDSIFIWEMLKKRMKIYTYPMTIAEVDQTTSTWFCGYNDKYFYDKGALFCALTNGWIAQLFCLQDLVRHFRIYKETGSSFQHKMSAMKKGIRGYGELISYADISDK